MRNIYLHIDMKRLLSGKLALATMISTSGSTPQKPGNSALFDTDGLILGTVGGGVLEARVQEIAVKAAMTGVSSIYRYDLNNDISLKSEAICGGEVSVLIDASPEKHYGPFSRALSLINDGIAFVMGTIISGDTGDRISVRKEIFANSGLISQGSDDEKDIDLHVQKLLKDRNPDSFSLIEKGPGEKVFHTIFLEPVFPPDRLIIAGAGHIGKALSHYGKRLGFRVTVIDDRPDFANKQNLGDTDEVIVDNVGRALDEIKKGPDTYIVIVTRGHSDDADALRSCIRSGAAYLGMIGSRTKIARMRADFLLNGWASEDEWLTVHAPVGLDIMSKTIEEIALSIAAEIVLERNRKKRGDG